MSLLPFKAEALGLLTLLGAWQTLSWAAGLEIFPPPTTVVPLCTELMFGGLFKHFMASAVRVLAAVGLAVITAAPLGLVLGQSRPLNAMFSPLVALLYPVPKIVFLPIAYLFLGVNDAAKITLIAVIIFFQILVTVRDEATNIPVDLLRSVQSLGAGRRGLLRFVYLPATLPAMLSAVRVSVGIAVAVLFITEQSLTQWGLGYYIVVETYQTLRYPEMYAGIMAMGLLGLTLYFCIAGLERALCPHLRIS